MTAEQLIAQINSLGDDLLPDDDILAFLNDGLAEIGREMNATFPFLTSVNDEPKLPEKWQRLLLVPFGKGRLKEKDSSQFEWESGYDQFYSNLSDFKGQYTVPKEYKDLEAGTELNVGGTTMYASSGDTLYLIAQEENVPLSQLKSDNSDVDISPSGVKSNVLTEPNPILGSGW